MKDGFLQNSTLGYMTKTLNHIIFFPPPKSEYFFQQHWESVYRNADVIFQDDISKNEYHTFITGHTSRTYKYKQKLVIHTFRLIMNSNTILYTNHPKLSTTLLQTLIFGLQYYTNLTLFSFILVNN